MTVGGSSADDAFRHRPAPIAALNAVGRALARFGIADALNVDTMVAAATRRARLADFGDDAFMTPLNVLVDAINREARLTPAGRLIQRQRIVGALVNRLRVQDLLRRHPEIADGELGRIVLIAGMQRTGTTMLQRLFASNAEVRSLSAWEALNPAPMPGEGRTGTQRRMRHGKTAENALRYLAPSLSAIHPIEHDAPEEEILLLDLSFMSQTFEATMHVPTYARWLEDQDHTAPYEYLRTLLKVLAWQRPGRTWVLKSPQHLEHLDVVLEILPGTTVVHTHRDPGTALVSFCSMVAHARGMLSDHVDLREISAHWIRKTHRMVGRGLAVRASADPDRFIDVSYYDLVRDPVAVLRRVCRQAGVPLGAAAVAAAERTNRINRQHRYGRHVYEAGTFAVSGRCIERCFASYRAAFGIPSESAGAEAG